MSILIKNASEILTMNDGLGILKDRSIIIDHGVIAEIGAGLAAPSRAQVIDARKCVVMPGMVDCHTHLVFAGSREDEFALRIGGVKYEEIARQGGGIANTVAKTRTASEDELYNLARERIDNLVRSGTTTVEIKSGYGLSRAEELKILRVIRRLRDNAPIEVVSTFLVHAVPVHMKRRDYVDMVLEEILPAVAHQKIAEFCDVFCDKGAFPNSDTEKILDRARSFNMKLKIHADELSNTGGADLAARTGCVSADHLIYTTKSGVRKMRDAGVMPVLLPGTTLYLRSKRRPKIQDYYDERTAFAIASDYNPGTCLIYSLPRIMALACLLYGVEIESALLAVTINAARALDRGHRLGFIRKGMPADLVVLNVNNYKKIVYQFGEDLVQWVIKKGKIIYGKNR
jgi:imidazolonepropionase